MGTAVLGAGPAGLTAAYVLGLRGVPAAVYEADGTVGGIAKTVEYNGYRFDLGGHRFFTKFAQVERLWEETLGDDFLVRPRLSRIYYDGQVPRVSAAGAGRRLRGSAIVESVLCALSYFRSRLCAVPPRDRDVRGLGDAELRQPALRRLLPLRTRRRCGASRARRSTPSGRRSGSRTSRSGRRCWPRSISRRSDAHDADRGVPLPAARPRADVGGLRGARRGARHPGPPSPPRADDPPRPRPSSRA